MIPQSARVPLVTVDIAGRKYHGYITLPWYQYLNIEAPAETTEVKKLLRPGVVLNLGGSGSAQQGMPMPGPRGRPGPRGASGVIFMQQSAKSSAPTTPTNAPKYGTYTPTLTNVANLDASTAFACQYAVTGRIVTVSGRVDVDPTAAGAARLGMSLPVTSNFGAAEECGGVAFSAGGQGAAISADAANNRADFNFTAIGAANIAMQFVFQYRII